MRSYYASNDGKNWIPVNRAFVLSLIVVSTTFEFCCLKFDDKRLVCNFWWCNINVGWYFAQHTSRIDRVFVTKFLFWWQQEKLSRDLVRMFTLFWQNNCVIICSTFKAKMLYESTFRSEVKSNFQDSFVTPTWLVTTKTDSHHFFSFFKNRKLCDNRLLN